jgi:hypothetical protein
MSRSDWPVDLDPIFKCWLWTGRFGRNGYPIASVGNHVAMAYRAVYEAEVGPIADGLVADHLCRDIRCCNPRHIEPVTKSENERRKRWAVRAKRQTCPRGHRMEAAIVTPRGGRVCRTCAREGSDEG